MALSFGFSLSPFSRFRAPGEMLEVAQHGEELGFSTILLPEHLLTPVWPTADMVTKFWFDLPTVAGYLAGATRSIAFMTGVMVIPYHPPVQMAKALATADYLSGGRIRLGVGSGWMKAEFKRLAIPYEERADMTDEYLRAMKELWTSDTPSFAGKYVSFDSVSFFPKPAQPNGIPYFAGGTGPRPFRRIVELCEGWYPMAIDAAGVRSGVTELRRRFTEAGRDPSSLWVGVGFSVSVDPQMARMTEHVTTTGGGGAGDDKTHGIAAERKTPEECVAGIRELQDAGASFVSCGFSWETAGDLKAALTGFARDVMPAFR
jgi:probable F420-dependent oxidoreductase